MNEEKNNEFENSESNNEGSGSKQKEESESTETLVEITPPPPPIAPLSIGLLQCPSLNGEGSLECKPYKIRTMPSTLP